jgi:hypothetical protein
MAQYIAKQGGRGFWINAIIPLNCRFAQYSKKMFRLSRPMELLLLGV